MLGIALVVGVIVAMFAIVSHLWRDDFDDDDLK